MSDHRRNDLLARLDPATYEAVEGALSVVHLAQGHVINQAHSLVDKVVFPHGGIVSCVVDLKNGGAIETGMIGKDGQFGAGQVLDHKCSLNLVVMQVAGDASVMEGRHFRELASEHAPFRSQVLSYEQFFLGHVQQTAACNAAHSVEARTCKWLLRMQRLVGDDLQLTQEFLAEMMGVRRTSVTEVAGHLQRAGMISYSRGRIHIRNLVQIQSAACECDAAVNANHARVFN